MIELSSKMDLLIQTYLPWIPTIPVIQGMSWSPTWKSLPNLTTIRGKKVVSPLCSIRREVLAYLRTISNEQVAPTGVVSSLVLWFHWIRYPLDLSYHVAQQEEISQNWWKLIDSLRSFHSTEQEDLEETLHLGRLASVVEGGGKLRLFVIGNYVKQRLLKPYHDWAMAVLRRLPNDGTFHQTAPLRWLKNRMDVYSFDLKSATDRWPRLIMNVMMGQLFGQQTATAVVETALGLSFFTVGPPLIRSHSLACFRIGQPLGYYSSWALFALSHHLIVWLAADRAGARKV